MIGADTSVVLRLLIGLPEDQALQARELLVRGSEPLAVSDLVVGESYFALRHHYDVPHAEAIHALIALFSDNRIYPTGIAPSVLAIVDSESAPGLMDRLIHADYERAGAGFVTFDRAAARLQGATLLS